MMALIQTYLNSKRQNTHTQQILEQNFELQLVSELIRDSVRSAGFMPCIGINHLITRDRRGKPGHPVAVDLHPGKHQSFMISRMGEDFATVLKQLAPARLLVDGGRVFDSRHPVVIADCLHAEIHLVASSHKTREGWIVTLTKPLDFNYALPFYFGEWLEERFSVEKNNQGKPALFYDTRHREELTDLIDGLASQQESTLLRITLRLAAGGEIVLETQVRTP